MVCNRIYKSKIIALGIGFLCAYPCIAADPGRGFAVDADMESATGGDEPASPPPFRRGSSGLGRALADHAASASSSPAGSTGMGPPRPFIRRVNLQSCLQAIAANDPDALADALHASVPLDQLYAAHTLLQARLATQLLTPSHPDLATADRVLSVIVQEGQRRERPKKQ